MGAADPLHKVLQIDLTRRAFRVERREDLFRESLGGTGVAIRLLEEHSPPDADPLGPDNPIVLAVGPLTGFFPLASKTVALFRSPHTGMLGESHCGGRSATALRLAGYGAMVVTGASDIPLYLSVHEGKVRFHDASTLWGMSGTAAVGRIIREQEEGAGTRSIMRIGRAGERLVSYAAVTTESYRHFGRLGLGAVFGSKRLKALVIAGRRALQVADPKAYHEVYDEIYRSATASPVMKKYHDLGTAGNVASLSALGGLPVRNLGAATLDNPTAISGEHLAEHYLGRRLACGHCPVGCIHIAALREPHPEEPYFYKTSMISYDYELIYALGSMLGVTDAQGLLRLMDRVEAVGIDAISAGVVLAWATEAHEKGLIGPAETGGVPLAWGDVEVYMRAVGMIADGEGEFWKTLGRGVDAAAVRYGGREFALALGGNEMAGYHTGPAAHLGFLLGCRHSHLDNAGYSADQKNAGKPSPEPEALVDSLLAEERWRQVLSSLAVCFFARGIYTPEVTARALAAVGIDLDEAGMRRLGEDVHRRKHAFRVRHGFDPAAAVLPGRLFATSTPAGPLDPEYLRRGIARFTSLMT